MANHLAGETSRYLQQHADNPVDWYPWGEEALAKARAEEKPIFLSIGYSACHWCHVMAHESFEDEGTAAILNTHFISIKVDREERPDLDRIYMNAVQALTGSGGWPMSVFLTPEGEPFYGGTYFPKEPRHGLPAFRQILLAIADAWEQRRDDLRKGGKEITAALQGQQPLAAADALDPTTIEAAYQALGQRFDTVHGGWGGAPKFPQPMILEFLLRYHHTTGDAAALAMVTRALEAMARGGIYDQLGGGFHRYATDARWTVPHFEKMLYDNAQLARVYLHAWQVTGSPLFRAVVEETLDYVVREMTHPQGGFYATQDADSEGKEGAFFLWKSGEIREALQDAASPFLEAYNVRDEGNFEGQTILTFSGTLEERDALQSARRTLLERRAQRPHPGRDEKILTAWNGLMLAAFAEAAQAFGRDDYREVAEQNATFLLGELRTPSGALLHTWKEGHAKIKGFLEDYANLIAGLLALHQTTFEGRWYAAAEALAEQIHAHFRAEVGFYDTADDAEALVLRPRELQDNATPSGNAMAATVLLKLARLSGKTPYEDLARASLAAQQSLMGRYPLGFGQWLIALDDALAMQQDIAIVGDPEAQDTRALLDVAADGYHPHRTVVAGQTGSLPLLRAREQIDGKATTYLCVGATCRQPVVTPEALRELLS